MSGQHAFLPPSAAAAWVACALWPTMNQRYPETDDKPAAREGTAAHWTFEEMLYRRPIDAGHVAPNGVAVTGEMIEGAEMYVAAVAEAYASMSVSHYHVEERIDIPDVHPANWGTPDTWLFGHNPTSGRARLVLPDYKFGHEFIEVFENWQLVDYACGILHALEIDGSGDEWVDVELVIVQPRAHHKDGPVRRWMTTAAALRPLFNKLRNAAEAAHQAAPEARPGPDNCKHCPGRHACEALQREGYKTAAVAGMSVPIEMTQEAMGLELKMLQRAVALAQARASGLAEQIEHALLAGKPSPHYAMVPSVARLGWNRPDAEILALGQVLGVNLAKPAEAITPTQANKLLDPAVLGLYSHRPRGSLKLEPVDVAGLRKVFGGAP